MRAAANRLRTSSNCTSLNGDPTSHGETAASDTDTDTAAQNADYSFANLKPPGAGAGHDEDPAAPDTLAATDADAAPDVNAAPGGMQQSLMPTRPQPQMAQRLRMILLP